MKDHDEVGKHGVERNVDEKIEERTNEVGNNK